MYAMKNKEIKILTSQDIKSSHENLKCSTLLQRKFIPSDDQVNNILLGNASLS